MFRGSKVQMTAVCLVYIAFATAIVNGMTPEKCNFDQKLMRKHLLNCLMKGKLTPFPITKERRWTHKQTYEESFQVYCSCRMQQMYGTKMMQCSTCKEWYHVDFISVPKQALNEYKVRWCCQCCTVVCISVSLLIHCISITFSSILLHF